MSKKRALVAGAGGFIGSHLVKKLKDEGFWVRGVDLKFPEFSPTKADEFKLLDLRNASNCAVSLAGPEQGFDEVYQLAATMGGAGVIFTGDNDADIMYNSAQINLNFALLACEFKAKKLFFSSSACIYSQDLQTDPQNPGLKEPDAYPANPDSPYGWEKLFSEILYNSFHRNNGLDIRIARFHNIFGEKGSWNNGKEKAPAAMCRKIAEAEDGGTIEVWGDGCQTRSFLYIDECLKGVRKLMDSDITEPINIGSDEMVSINELVEIIAEIADKDINIKHIEGPLGVAGRNSDNTLIKKLLKWAPNYPLKRGLKKTYKWINKQVKESKANE